MEITTDKSEISIPHKFRANPNPRRRNRQSLRAQAKASMPTSSKHFTIN